MGFPITWNQKKGEAAAPPPTETVDPLKCSHCDFTGKNAQSLRLHTTKKHGA